MDTENRRKDHAHWNESRELLSRRWAVFAALALRPELVILAGLTVCLIVFAGWSAAAAHATGAATQVFVAVIACIFSGLVGVRIGKAWQELREEERIATRGRRVVRDLQLLLQTIASMKRKIDGYLDELPARQGSGGESGRSSQVTRERYRMLLDRCGLLEAEVLRAAQEWAEEIPQLPGAFTDAAQVSDLTTALEAAQEQNRALQDELREIRYRRDEDGEDDASPPQNPEAEGMDSTAEKEEPADGKLSPDPAGEISALPAAPIRAAFQNETSIEVQEAAVAVGVNGGPPDDLEGPATCPECGSVVAPSRLGISVCSSCSHSWTEIERDFDSNGG